MERDILREEIIDKIKNEGNEFQGIISIKEFKLYKLAEDIIKLAWSEKND